MAKRYMSDSEYEQQQFRWRQKLVDPHLLQSFIDDSHDGANDDDEVEKQRKQELRERLWVIVMNKIEKSLTPRQQDAIKLFLLGKKQEHMGSVLGVTQEAANVRLRLGLERLRKVCSKDKEIQQILEDIRAN
jgi:DNA-directed RNA polymerase specialized sigma24 family protein